jgi:dolichol-phosphate mannosyltransferase
MQFLMLGIIGAYLGRLYDQSKGRPLFMIREIVGGPQ